MNNKNLIIRYISYFFISSFSLVLIINIFKQNELEYSLNEYEKFISKEYSKYYDEYKNNSELIYFNEFIKNKELIKIFKNISQNNIENSKKELNKSFKDSFNFYKTLDVFNISFYLPTNEFLLSMEENFKDSNILNIVDKVIVDKKELNSFRILDDKYYLIFSKPIFDENLKEERYIVHIKSEQKFLNDNEKLIIKPGMTLDADIIMGKKTILDYILRPIMKSLQIEGTSK